MIVATKVDFVLLNPHNGVVCSTIDKIRMKESEMSEIVLALVIIGVVAVGLAQFFGKLRDDTGAGGGGGDIGASDDGGWFDFFGGDGDCGDCGDCGD